MDTRNLLFRGSTDRHTGHSQPIIGTPVDVPDPRIVTDRGGEEEASTGTGRLYVEVAKEGKSPLRSSVV
jgi:hypothetical protein